MKRLMILGLTTTMCAMLAAACGGGKPSGNDGKKGGGGGDDVMRSPVPSAFEQMSPPDLSDSDLIAKGKDLYMNQAQANCVMCHGESGKGDGPQAANYTDPAVADLTKASFHEAVTDQYIFWRIKEPVKSRAYSNSGMLGFPAGTDEQIWAIVAYVRSLKGK